MVLEPVAGINSNYNNAIGQPWAVGGGSEELNGIYEMMGNLWEWNETVTYSMSFRNTAGGSYGYDRGGGLSGIRSPQGVDGLCRW
jgi:formylglycine-generating enzyme required for sulfatase activity